MLALFLIIDPSVSLTPKSLTPDNGEEDEDAREERVGQVRELWPLLLQCEHRRVMVSVSAESTPNKTGLGKIEWIVQSLFVWMCVRERVFRKF
jgi:hypothetical protein